jgi:hypothetical protein
MDRDAKKLLSAYVSGRTDFGQFYDWFGAFSIQARDHLQGPELEAVRDIALSVAEFTSGDISEVSLKADIRKYAGIGPITLVVLGPEGQQRQVRTGASPASLVERQVAYA